MSYPDDLAYSREHEWVRADGTRATIGITSFAADELGDIVFVELPEVGAALTPVRDLRRGREREGRERPVRARLRARWSRSTRPCATAPELLNSDPFGEGWIAKVELRRRDRARRPAGRRGLRRSNRLSGGPPHDLLATHRCRSGDHARGDRRRVGRGSLRRHPGCRSAPAPGTFRRRSPSRRCGPSWHAWPAATGSRTSASSAPGCIATSCRPSSARSSAAPSSPPRTPRTSRRCSQGTLQSIYEFQSLVCELTGMEVATASHYDGATATAEAALMACRLTRRDRVAVSAGRQPRLPARPRDVLLRARESRS